MNAHQKGWLLPVSSVLLVSGVFIGRDTDNFLLAFAVCLLAVTAALLLKGRGRFTAILVFCLGLGIIAGSVSFHPALPPEDDYDVSAVISDEISSGSFGQVRVCLSDVKLNQRPFPSGAYWTFYTDELPEDLLPGKEVFFHASLYHPRGAVNPDGYDFRESLLHRGLSVGLYGNGNLVISEPLSFSFSGFVAGIRHHLSQSLIGVLGEETGSFASALLLGMRSLIPSEDRQAFSRLGIAHILSVSGFHVGILVGVLAFLFRLLRLRQVLRIILYSVVLFFYTALCGMSQPVIRASLLFLLASEGRVLNRPRSGIHLLSAVLFLMTLISPVQVTSASFQLTFCAMAGLIWFSPLTNYSRSVKQKIPRRLLDTLIITFGVQLGLLLPELYFFQRLPLLVFLINLPVMLFSSVLIFLFWIVLFFLPFPFLASFLSVPLSWLTSFLFSFVRRLASLPGLSLWIHTPTLFTAVGVILLFTGFCSFLRLRKIFRGGLLFLGIIVLVLSLLPSSHHAVEYIQFSAGNADAAILWDQDKVYVLDTGEADGTLSSFLRSHRLTPDAVILTHLHSDHAGGLRSMIDEEIPIPLILIPEGAEDQEIHPDFLSLLQELRQSNTEIRTISRGDVLSFPSGTLTVLWPDKGKIRTGQDPNQYSLVSCLNLNGTVFLHAGDLPGNYEGYCSVPADILKASHHGSSSSTLPDFLSAVSPDCILLSCRQMSRLLNFRERVGGSSVYGTPESGAVTILFETNCYSVLPYLHN